MAELISAATTEADSADWWQSTAMEREFAAICARERLAEPTLRCTYTTPG